MRDLKKSHGTRTGYRSVTSRPYQVNQSLVETMVFNCIHAAQKTMALLECTASLCDK